MEPASSTVNSTNDQVNTTQQPTVSQAHPTEQPMDEDVNNNQDQGNISIIYIYPWRLVDGHDQNENFPSYFFFFPSVIQNFVCFALTVTVFRDKHFFNFCFF